MNAFLMSIQGKSNIVAAEYINQWILDYLSFICLLHVLLLIIIVWVCWNKKKKRNELINALMQKSVASYGHE